MANTSITSGQKTQFLRVVTDAVGKGLEMAINEFARAGTIDRAGFQRIHEQGYEISSHLITEARKKMVGLLSVNGSDYLKCISLGKVITIGPTDGTKTIAQAKDTFRSHIDPHFESWDLVDVPSGPTKATEVQVFEKIKAGTFSQLFGSFGGDLDRLCFKQSQVEQFCSEHSDWLCTDGSGTLFLLHFHWVYFVVIVYPGFNGLSVHTLLLSHDHVWGADFRHRLVIPQ